MRERERETDTQGATQRREGAMTTSKDKIQQFMESPLVAWVSAASRGGGREMGEAGRNREYE